MSDMIDKDFQSFLLNAYLQLSHARDVLKVTDPRLLSVNKLLTHASELYLAEVNRVINVQT